MLKPVPHRDSTPPLWFPGYDNPNRQYNIIVTNQRGGVADMHCPSGILPVIFIFLQALGILPGPEFLFLFPF